MTSPRHKGHPKIPLSPPNKTRRSEKGEENLHEHHRTVTPPSHHSHVRCWPRTKGCFHCLAANSLSTRGLPHPCFPDTPFVGYALLRRSRGWPQSLHHRRPACSGQLAPVSNGNTRTNKYYIVKLTSKPSVPMKILCQRDKHVIPPPRGGRLTTSAQHFVLIVEAWGGVPFEQWVANIQTR